MTELSLYAGDSLEAVVGLYGTMIYRLAYARTANVHDAEDILQEVFLRYAKSGKEGKMFESEEHRKAWLLRVTINCSKSSAGSGWNKRRNKEPLSEETPDTRFSPEACDTRLSVRKAVAALSEKYRTVIHLFYFEELSIKEISDIAGLSESAVKARLSRAREKLKASLKEVDFYG